MAEVVLQSVCNEITEVKSRENYLEGYVKVVKKECSFEIECSCLIYEIQQGI